MVFKLVESAQAPMARDHVRPPGAPGPPGARFENGVLVERSEVAA
jgi:hypothetical protein